ncbi:putative cell wall-binding protein [Catenulispora sp. EB89]|uniref:LpqB family beta-propeller domain-containing protein n=1 Tax=Catenulispora sp. EB89 TaxID=3156257 RepID=UPI0035171D0B
MPKKSRLLSAAAVLSSVIAMATVSPSAGASLPGDLSGVITFLPGSQPSNGPLLASVNADGSNPRQWWPAGMPQPPMTGGMARVSSMAYSPDGSKLALVATTKSPSRLYVMAADGSDAHAVAWTNSADIAWSADGKSIYIVQYGSEKKSGNLVATIVRMSPDGGGAVPVVTVTGPGNPNIDSFKVSSKGDIAYDVRVSNGSLSNTSYLFHAASGQTTQLPAAISGYDFSPDGTSLMYPQAADKVCVLPVSGGSCTTISTAATASEVAWSPDGTEFAYGSGEGPSGTLTIADLTGKTVAKVAPAFGVGSKLTWQPHAYHGAPAPAPTADRVAGADRFGTAINASRLQFADHSAPVAVLSRSDTYADALAGSALAAEKHGPLLLTPTDSLDASTAAELHRALAPGATVYLLGGPKALSPAVEQALHNQGFTTKRLQGPDRYQTSVAIAEEITPDPSTILLATGNNYPDALAAGATAGARTGAVVLLTNDSVLPPQVRTYLTASLTKPVIPSVLAVGGPADNAENSLNGLPFTDLAQVGGIDRYDTAARLAAEYGSTQQVVGLATGNTWPDALAGGAIAAAHGAPLLLSNGPTVPTTELLHISTRPYEAPDEILVFGGTKAVPDAAVATLENATARTGWVSHTNRVLPELP